MRLIFHTKLYVNLERKAFPHLGPICLNLFVKRNTLK